MSSPSLFAGAIGQAEGFGVPGAIPTLANNPGDLALGDIGHGTLGQGITIYGSAEEGWQALESQLGKITAGSSAYYSPQMSISQMGEIYSGGDPNWARNVSSALGASPSSPIGSYLPQSEAGTPQIPALPDPSGQGFFTQLPGTSGDNPSTPSTTEAAAAAGDSGSLWGRLAAGLVGVICIGVGLMMFKQTQTIIQTGTRAVKTAAAVAAGLILALASSAWSQSCAVTPVTATVIDSDAQAWAGAAWTATLYNPSGTQQPVCTNTGQAVPVSIPAQALNAGGHLSYSFTDNNAISPAGTRWIITLCSNTSAACNAAFSPLLITGTATQDISAAITPQLVAPRFAPGANARGYADGEVTNPLQGSMYYNTISLTMRQFNGTAWVAMGGGGSGSVGPLGTFAMNSGQGLQIYSDSTCQGGTGATAPQRGWAMLTAAGATTGLIGYNCISGWQTADIERKIMLPVTVVPFAASPVYLAETTINDTRSGNTAGQMTLWQQMGYFMGAYLSTPYGQIIHGDDTAQITPHGGIWTIDNALGTPIALATTAAGASLQFNITTSGGPLVLAQRAWNADTGTVTVSIDGQPATDSITNSSTLSNAPAAGGVVNTPSGTTDVVIAARFPGLASGTHTVIYTCVTPGTHGCSFFGAWTTYNFSGVYQPPVFVQDGNPYQFTDTNSAVTASYNTAALNNAALLKSDGFNVYSVNLRALMDPNNSMDGTGLNPGGFQGTDGAITTGTNIFTSSQAQFNSNSVGKYVIIMGAGPNPGGVGGTTLSAKIQQYVSATQVNLEYNAAATVSGATYYYGLLGQVIPASTAAGAHPNDLGADQWARANLAVINPTGAGRFGGGGGYNPTTPTGTSSAQNWSSDIGNKQFFPTAGTTDVGTTLNQGWMVQNLGNGYEWGGFLWGGYDSAGNGTEPRGPAIAWNGLGGGPNAASVFNVFPSAKSYPHTNADLGAPMFSVDRGQTYLTGFGGKGSAVVSPQGTAIATTNYGSNTVNLAQFSIWNGTSAQLGSVALSTSVIGGVNTAATWKWQGCAGAAFVCHWQIQNFADVTVSSPLIINGVTVATLPACSAALKGAQEYVTDATAPTYLGTLTGGGAVVTPVFCNGTAWVSF